MTSQDILKIRLYNQQLTQKKFKTPADVISWFGAMQAQDYPSAKWGLGQRLENTTDNQIEKAFEEGKILRTHVMRPTWHFVAPDDIRWMLDLTAPRVKKILSYYDRLLGLDDMLLKSCYEIFRETLQKQNYLTRTELAEELEKNGIKLKGQILGHTVEHAELDALICSGPRRGKQFTYALLDEKAEKTKKLTNDEALAELTKRYFQSHGPATVKDFVWWSGLTASDARRGISTQRELKQEIVHDKTYWFFTPPSKLPEIPGDLYLLPNYDEYGIAYTEREVFFSKEYNKLLDSRGNATFQHLILYQGIMIGTWKRVLKKDSILIETKFFHTPSLSERQAIEKAAKYYGRFLNQKVLLTK